MATKINAAVIFSSIDNSKVNYSVYRYACSVTYYGQNNLIMETRKRLQGYVSENSIAYDMLSTDKQLSKKQLWVISYELLKNETYCKNVENFIKKNGKFCFNQNQLSQNEMIERIQEREGYFPASMRW